ncbi:MAG: AAA family ATPase [Acholeplasmatales bacterium]|nr:AAA family ATPase [Acholeplasmatales bacterium]
MIVLIGPSASGKTAVGKYLEEKYNIRKVVTYTTRDKRIGEIEGIDYHYISREDFLDKLSKHFFFETMEYNKNFYGTSIESLKDDSYLILDITGYNSYKQSSIKLIPFFLETSKALRKERMEYRQDNPLKIKERLELDDVKFNKDLLDSSVHIIKTDNLTIEEVGQAIYKIIKEQI